MHLKYKDTPDNSSTQDSLHLAGILSLLPSHTSNSKIIQLPHAGRHHHLHVSGEDKNSLTIVQRIVVVLQVQAVPLMLLVHIGDKRLEMFVTTHPLFRLPLFLMGVAAGLLSLRRCCHELKYIIE